MAESNVKTSEHVTQQAIVEGLRSVGISEGDTALVHSSLSAFGYVQGGADAVIDALLEALGPSGTLVLPTFTWDDFHAKRHVTFDLANTPCETGRIPEIFRKRPGVIRSRHICHSVAAIGPHAQDVIGEGVRSFGVGSTFDQLYQLDSWVLLLGVSFGVCTALHMVEEFMQVPYRRYRDFRRSRIILPDGTTLPSRSVEFLREECYQNDFEKMGAIFAREGILKRCQVGEALVTSVRIRDLFDVTKRYMEEDIYFLLTEATRPER